MTLRDLRLITCAALVASTQIVVHAQTTARCPELEQYLAANERGRARTPQQQRQFAEEWLPRLLARVDEQGCGGGITVSARWHAMTLASQLSNWSLARDLAAQGAAAAASGSERALWQMNKAGASYHGRTAGDAATVRAAIRDLDAFLAIAPLMTEASPGVPTPAWLLPSMNALTWKAQCLRDLGDDLGAAAVEQRAATTFVAAQALPASNYGGFLPEECLYRAALDYCKADRPSDAAGTLASIGLLTGRVRPAGQHAWNAIASLANDYRKALGLAEQLVAQLPMDEWTPLQAWYLGDIMQDPDCTRDELLRATAVVSQVLSSDEMLTTRATDCMRRVQADAGLPAVPDLSSGVRAILMRHRARMETRAGEIAAAEATISEMRRRGYFPEWCDTATRRIGRR